VVFPQDAKTAASAEKPNFKVIIGEWVKRRIYYVAKAIFRLIQQHKDFSPIKKMIPICVRGGTKHEDS